MRALRNNDFRKTLERVPLLILAVFAAWKLLILGMYFFVPSLEYASSWRLLFIILGALPLVIICCITMRKRASFFLSCFGMLLNSLVIFLNDGRMPISPIMYHEAGIQKPLGSSYVFIDETTVLPTLGDWIYFPHAIGIFSPGDVLLWTGCAFFCCEYWRWKKRHVRAR